MRRSARVFLSAVLSECVTLALRPGLEKTMASHSMRTWLADNRRASLLILERASPETFIVWKRASNFTNWLILSGPLQYARLCGLEIIRPSVTKPLRREHTSIRPPIELSRQEGNYGRKGAARKNQAGLPLVHPGTLGNRQRKWPLAAGTVSRRGTTSPCLANKQPRKRNQRPSKSSWRIRRIPMTRSCSTR